MREDWTPPPPTTRPPWGWPGGHQPLGIPVIALAGSLGRGFEAVYEHGISAAVCIVDRPLSMRVSVARTSELLTAAAERAMRLLAIPTPAS